MEADVSTAQVAAAPTKAAPAPRRPASTWLVSPGMDLLVFANLWWLLAAWPVWVHTDGSGSLEFWQVYLLTTPHRWLTLILVALDPERRSAHPRRLLYWALAFGLLIAAVATGFQSLQCLALVDYLWNAWHFGAQHGGILRIYSRTARLASPRWEAWPVRILVPYCSLRLAGWTTGWLEGIAGSNQLTMTLDALALALPTALLVMGAVEFRTAALGRMLYLTSVTALYGCLLLALQLRASNWITTLVVCAAAFHALEYLALVSLYARRRASQGPAGAFQRLARFWSAALLLLVLTVAAVHYVAVRGFATWWYAINLWCAFLHYTYDGMIWKLRNPQTARRLAID